jgi:hypothetical protein
MFKYASRIAAAAAIVPIAVAIGVMPSQAQTATGTVAVTGTASCNAATGHPTWTLHWTITNTLAVEIPDRVPAVAPVPQILTVDAAVESGLVDADITDGVSPNPIPANSSATATDGPIGNAVGDVVLTVDYSAFETKDSVEGTVHLDGSCVLVEPTTTSTTSTTSTAPPAVKTAVTAKPAFTG